MGSKSISSSTPAPMPNAFGVYVHIPFCVHKCSYCDFYSFTQYTESEFSPYVARVQAELRAASAWLRNTRGANPKVGSIFFGGGTPSLLSPDLVARLLATIDESFPIEPGAEITLEANPETVSLGFAQQLRQTRVNRISLGAQSFQTRHLAALERRASPESVRQAVQFLRQAGFDNLNLDLIFAIPGQTKEEWLADLEEIRALGPDHLSAYVLSLKPAHVLYPRLPDEDTSADWYELAEESIARLGYPQYEISNYARPGRESRHNLLYWDGGDFLGVGPSASSRFFWDGVFHHRKQVADYGAYLTKPQALEFQFEPTTRQQTVLEASFLELRKNGGVSARHFEQRYGYDLMSAKRFSLFAQEGLLTVREDRVLLTPRGRLLADTVTRDLVDF